MRRAGSLMVWLCALCLGVCWAKPSKSQPPPRGAKKSKKPDAQGQKSDARGKPGATKSKKPDAKGQKSDVKGKPAARGRQPDATGGQATIPPRARPQARPRPASPRAAKIPVTFLFPTELGGRLRRFRCRKKKPKKGKKAKAKLDLAHLVAGMRAAQKSMSPRRPVLLNVGGNLSGTHEMRFVLEQGSAGAGFVARLLGGFGFHMIGLGPGDLAGDVGQKKLFFRSAQRHKLPLLASNLSLSSSHPLSGLVSGKKLRFLQRGKARIALLHLLPKSLSVDAAMAKGLKVHAPIAWAKKQVKALRKLKPPVDLVVVVSQLGSKGSKARALAAKVPGIDLIISHHLQAEHGGLQSLQLLSPSGQTQVIGGPRKETLLGRIDLMLEKKPGQKARILSWMASQVPLRPGRFDPPTRKLLLQWEARYCNLWGKRLGSGVMPKGESMDRDQFSTYLLNLMRRASKAEIALVDKGEFGSSPFPIRDHVTRDDLYRTLPRNPKLIVASVPGHALSNWLSLDGAGLIGFADDKVNGQEVQSKRYYRVVTVPRLLRRQRKKFVERLRQAEKDRSSLEKQLRKAPGLGADLKKKRARLQKLLGKPGGKGKKPDPKKLKALLDEMKKSPKVGQLVDALQRKQVELQIYRRELRDFDSRWRVLVRPGCPAIKNLRARCSDRCCVKLRTLISRHFAGDHYRSLTPISEFRKRKRTQAQIQREIPYTGAFLKLEDKVRWQLNADLSLRFDSQFVSPTNLVGQYNNLPNEFFQQFQLAGGLELELLVGTLSHQWKTNASIKYGGYFRSQNNQDKNQVDTVFDEPEDQIELTTRYAYTRSKRVAPFVQFQLLTEFTRRGRPHLSDVEYVEQLKRVRFREFKTSAVLGVEWKAVKSDAVNLNLSLGATWSKRFDFDRFPVLGSDQAKKYGELENEPDVNHYLGGTLKYSLSIQLFKVRSSAVTLTSEGEYGLSFNPTTTLTQLLSIHNFTSETQLSIALTRSLSFRLGFKAVILRETLPGKAPSDGERAPRVEGPWAYWLVPSASFAFNWGARGQSF